MEPTSTNNENTFDPIPKLISSPVPIFFVPFNHNEDVCMHCKSTYSKTLLFDQKYCKNCLYWYIKYTLDNSMCMDVHISTSHTPCNNHESTRKADFCSRKIQEWCENCSEISYFKQIVPYSTLVYLPKMNDRQIDIIKSEEDCKLCGKLIYKQVSPMYGQDFKICSACYLISAELSPSPLIKKSIPILHLPWWDPSVQCRVCSSDLIFLPDCQKRCLNCLITYTGCRYCLTTNIVFGITDQSQCKKCQRITTVNDWNNVDKFHGSIRFNSNDYGKIADYILNIHEDSNPLNVYKFISIEFRYIKLSRVPVTNK